MNYLQTNPKEIPNKPPLEEQPLPDYYEPAPNHSPEPAPDRSPEPEPADLPEPEPVKVPEFAPQRDIW